MIIAKRCLLLLGIAVLASAYFLSRSTAPAPDTVLVVRVIDGDTIEIEGGERVRYIGINTPESVDRRRGVQCFGKEAARKNEELVEGKRVRLEKDVRDRDRYGRLLRYVWLDETFVNLELVKQGFAYASSYPPNVRYQDLFREAEQEAQSERRGLWNKCPPAKKKKSR